MQKKWKHVYSNGNIVSCFKTQLIYQKRKQTNKMKVNREREKNDLLIYTTLKEVN